jgi:GT2 family glycosyltransferase
MSSSKVSVIIPTRDNFDLLVNSVNNLGIKTLYSNYEILVICTSSDEKMQKKVKGWADNSNWPLKVFEYKDDFNFAELNTKAVKEYTNEDTKYVLFMNDDCEPVNDVISILVNFYESNPDIGTVSAQLRNRDESIQSMGYLVTEYENSNLELKFHAVNERDKLFYSRHFKVAANSAVCMLTSRELFLELDGFQSVYIEDLADVEYSLRCILNGKYNYCLGYAIAVHHLKQTRGLFKGINKRVWYDYINNLAPFMELYKVELREAGIFQYIDRKLLQRDWCIGNSHKIESNFKDLEGGPIYRDPFEDNNLELQKDFEDRYSLQSDDGKLHVLMIGHKSGCGWIRIDNPAYMLNKCAEDIIAFPTDSITPELINWAHTIVWEVPVPSNLNATRDFLTQIEVPQAFEVDDDYLHIDEFNIAKERVDSETVLNWVKNTNMLTVTRDSLGKMYKEVIPTVNYKVLPNCINFDRFPKTEYNTNNDHIKLGWMGGCTHYSDLKVVVPVIKKLKAKYGDKLEICLFGWDGKLKPPFFTPKNLFAGIDISYYGFVDIYKYYDRLITLDFDICFIPLADNTFNNIGKSPLKYLEASAAKFPCVVSDSPVFDFIDNGETAFKAKTEEEWEIYLTLVIEDIDLRNKLSNNGYELVYNDFNLEKHISKWADSYRELALSSSTINVSKDE